MELYSIKGLRDEILGTNYFSEISRRDFIELHIDKCNYILTLIIQGIRSKDKPLTHFINIKQSKLKKSVGSNHLDKLLLALEKLGYIKINHKYRVAHFPKSYRLTNKSITQGIVRVTVISSQFKNKLHKLNDQIIISIKTDKTFEKLTRNTCRLKTRDSFLDWYPDLIPPADWQLIEGEYVDVSKMNATQVERYSAFFNDFLSLNNSTNLEGLVCSPIFFAPSRSNYGRIYHVAASIPKKIRRLMITKDDQLLYEVDMASAQLSLLFLTWARYLHERDVQPSPKEEQEKALCLRLLQAGSIYNYISQHSKYFQMLERDTLKTEILKTINGPYRPSEAHSELHRLFPNLFDYINTLKQNKGHKYISHSHQKAESDIFVWVYDNLPDEMFSILIHDCILTIKEHTLYIRDLLEKRTKDLYKEVLNESYSLNNLFRIDLVSLHDEDLFDNQHDKYLKSQRNLYKE